MSLITSAWIVSLTIGFFTLLPWFFSSIRNYSKPLLIIGSAVLFGFIFFDLIPEMMEIGGITSLAIMAVAWAAFAGIHYLQAHEHSHHADHDHDHGAHSHAGAFLLFSMALHCFAGGMLLVSSYEISTTLASHVFLSLISHKVFEAVTVASVLLEKIRSKKELYLATSIYALSFPAGVLVTVGGRSALAGKLAPESIEMIAMVITSIAVGSLMGCLLQDFLIPAFRSFRSPQVKVRQQTV